MTYFEVRDAIHKTIRFSDEEKRIIGHPYVQRLRFIRQLGFVPLVYPSATHDRFSHSLGTMHVASLLAKQIFENEECSRLARILKPREKEFLTRILRLAGLLHDIGHAPFSHSAEKVMPPVSELAIPASWWKVKPGMRLALHEDYSALLIAGMAEGKDKLFSHDEAHIIASLVHHKAIQPPQSWNKKFSGEINAGSIHTLMKYLISSDIDADRMDYLLRDSHGAGVVYGHYDLPWLISNLGTAEQNGDYVMTISETGVHALEHYLLARYNMYTSVYMHKTSKCFEYYFHRALETREIDYTIPSDRDEFVALRDSTLMEAFFRAYAKDPLSWSGRIVKRDPARRIARIWAEEGEVSRVFTRIEKDLQKYNVGVTPFLCFSRSKLLDIGKSGDFSDTRVRTPTLFDNPLPMPIKVIRNQFGVSSLAPLADYSFILRHYHQDINVGDIYILPEQYRDQEKTIRRILRSYRILSPSEEILEGND